jgi:hypothetical protein
MPCGLHCSGLRLLAKTALLLLSGVALVGCGGSSAKPGAGPASAAATSCPQAWKAGWQKLANEVGAPVFCPAWMPSPLDGHIGGQYANGKIVDKDHSYLVSFIWLDHDVGGVTGEVHVNFRGYPGRTAIPMCEDTLTVNGKTVHPKLRCFADPKGTRLLAGIRATLYTANQGIDQWHLLYAWRRNGSLYTLSEHVAPPYSYTQVQHNLERMTRGLVVVEPSS